MTNPFDSATELRRTQQEFRLQLAVVKHLELAFPTLVYTHIPNRPGDAKDGYFKKIMGAKAGAPDFVFWWKGGAGAVELKVPGSHIASAQNKFLSALHSVGVKTAVCRSVAEVHKALKSWGLKPRCETVREPDIRSDMQKKYDAHEIYAP